MRAHTAVQHQRCGSSGRCQQGAGLWRPTPPWPPVAHHRARLLALAPEQRVLCSPPSSPCALRDLGSLCAAACASLKLGLSPLPGEPQQYTTVLSPPCFSFPLGTPPVAYSPHGYSDRGHPQQCRGPAQQHRGHPQLCRGPAQQNRGNPGFQSRESTVQGPSIVQGAFLAV